jgi:hypothetical protein
MGPDPTRVDLLWSCTRHHPGVPWAPCRHTAGSRSTCDRRLRIADPYKCWAASLHTSRCRCLPAPALVYLLLPTSTTNGPSTQCRHEDAGKAAVQQFIAGAAGFGAVAILAATCSELRLTYRASIRGDL